MLNSIKTNSKKFICCLILSLAMLVSAFAGIHFDKQSKVLASVNNHIIEDVTSSDFGTGYNFNTTTSSKPNEQVSGWTIISNSSTNENIVKGVVNVESETSFDVGHCGTSRPFMPIEDKDTSENPAYYKNLMINSPEGSGRLGYEKNSALSLKANSFYRISVLLYTEKASDSNNATTDTTASIYLTGLLNEKDSDYSQHKFEAISTKGQWVEYVYFIETNEEKSVKLQLWLGSKGVNGTGGADSEGAVFFNEVKVLRYSEDAYAQQISGIQDTDGDNVNIIDLTPSQTPAIPFITNKDFETGSLNGWTRISKSNYENDAQLFDNVDVNTYSIVNEDLTITPPGSNCSANNQMALFLYNRSDDYQAVESTPFTIERHTYYKLSFWAKSDCNVGSGATVKLVDKSEENPIDSASLTLATKFTKGSNKFRNDWTQYSFYIYGPSSDAKEATIQVWLGTESSKTSGYVFVDDFSIEKINYDTYSNNSSSTNCTSFNLNNSEDKYTIVNGNFDKTKNSESGTVYPATPSGWTINGDNNTTTLSGIVNTSETAFDTSKFGTNPGKLIYEDSLDNNVLMIGSKNQTNNQTFTSENVTLSANSYYKFSCYVMTNYIKNDHTSDNNGAKISITSSTNVIYEYYNILFDDNNWHKIEVKIKTGSNQETANINLSLNGLAGFVFFDKVELRTISSEEIFNDTTFDSPTTQYVDLSYENFDNRTFNKNILTKNGIDKANNWTLNTNEESVSYGIIKADNIFISEDIPASISGNTNYLYFNSAHDTYNYFTSNESFTFDSATYYKISVNVLTRFIKEDDKVDYGASIALAESKDILLKGINTNGVWETYSIYVNLNEALTSKIALGLGYTDEQTSGEVLFDNLKITKIESEEIYKEEISEINPNKLNTIATFINYTAPSDAPADESEPWENNFDWLLVPSIITALAIIISVVGFYVRKINFNRKPKIKTNYDRRKTLDKDIDRREKIALRKQIIEELNAELKAIDNEINDFNKLAEEHLAELKAQIVAEQEELKKQKLDIEIKKKEATSKREKDLKESPELVSNTKAEKEYNNIIAKLDKQELAIQKKINEKDIKIENAKVANKDKISKYLERQEYIRTQIAKIEAEIEEIAKQEEQIWAEYKAAKADAKRRKAEYKAQIKSEKEQAKKKTSTKTTKQSNSKSE
ncbi:MAG: hypothetical protein IJW59_03665 [Clostridia bacterium]|nr:hypothetical protein [Clostridia bacterium]